MDQRYSLSYCSHFSSSRPRAPTETDDRCCGTGTRKTGSVSGLNCTVSDRPLISSEVNARMQALQRAVVFLLLPVNTREQAQRKGSPSERARRGRLLVVARRVHWSRKGPTLAAVLHRSRRATFDSSSKENDCSLRRGSVAPSPGTAFCFLERAPLHVCSAAGGRPGDQ